MTVRVRFAPSPTGYFHVGGGRTALYNWLFARQNDGEFLLRIEDTDVERNREEWVEGIQHAMRWLGLDWDHRVYRSSEFTHRHREAAEKLLASGHAYYCECTGEQVQQRKAERGEKTPGYDGFCRDRGLGPGEGRALRFRTPDDGATSFLDVVRGEPKFENSTIEDFVIIRSNGAAIFVLANVIEDIEMGITHVIRSEEHVSNVPKQVLLWEALEGGNLPVFAHLPLLVNEKRQKISKRRPEDRVAMEEYRDEGYLAEAMRNYLALLGWGPKDDQEILSMDDLLARFRLEDVNSSPAFFDQKKLRHFNGEYIRALPEPSFVQRSLPWLEDEDVPWPPERFDLEAFNRMAPLVQTRVDVLSQVPAMVDFLFVEDDRFEADLVDEGDWQKHVAGNENARAVLAGVLERYRDCAWQALEIEAVTWPVGEAHGLNKRKTQFPIRVAVTGKAQGPPLFESLEVLGRERVLGRIERALSAAS